MQDCTLLGLSEALRRGALAEAGPSDSAAWPLAACWGAAGDLAAGVARSPPLEPAMLAPGVACAPAEHSIT